MFYIAGNNKMNSNNDASPITDGSTGRYIMESAIREVGDITGVFNYMTS